MLQRPVLPPGPRQYSASVQVKGCEPQVKRASGRGRAGDPLRPQRTGTVPALTVLRAARAETTATIAVIRLIRDAFCGCVSCHQANPTAKDSVADTKAVTVPASATGCFLVCGHR